LKKLLASISTLLLSFLIVATFILSNSSADTFPIERVIVKNHRVVDADDLDTALKNVTVLQKMKLAVDITNPQDQAQRVATTVLVQNSNGDSVFDTWSEIVLDPTEASTQTFNWIAPIDDGLYTVTFFFWESVDNPTAIAPVTTLEFEVLPVDDTSVNVGTAAEATAFETICSASEDVELGYTISDGKVLESCIDELTPAVFMTIESDNGGQLTVEIPRTMVYSVNQDCESQDLIILVDGEEADAIIENTTFSRIITLDFPSGYNAIEFIGSYTLGENVHQYCGVIYGYDSQYLTPKKQVDRDRSPENVKCNEGLELILKSSNNSPACVKDTTAEKLQERNWSK